MNPQIDGLFSLAIEKKNYWKTLTMSFMFKIKINAKLFVT